MDQVKQILAVLVTHRFWVACGVMAPLLLGGWFTTTAKMKSDTKEGKDRIKGSFELGSAIRQTSPHPNPLSHAGLEKSEEAINAEVVAAWKIQYDQQRKFLVWPEELDEEFIRTVDGYRPIEKLKYTPNDPTNEIDIQYRELYRNYIQAELPKLAQIIGAQWMATGAASSGDMGPGMTGAPGMGGEMTSGPGYGGAGYGGASTVTSDHTANIIVAWDPTDQARLQSTRFDWRGMRNGVPRTLDILYAQENLWVMQALMRIIATTNQDATAKYNATVKEIKYIQMGREVGPTTSRVQRLQAAAAGGGMGTEGGMMGGGGEGAYDMGSMPGMGPGMGNEGSEMMGAPGMMGTPGMGNEGGTGSAAASSDPVHYRYVDNNYVPIEAERLRQVMENDNPSPEDAFLVVAKRIPIRMGMVVDQRKLHNFIAACGNSDLVVEVRQVRVNRIGSATAGGGMGGMSMGGMSGPSMGGMSGPSMGGMSMGGMSGPGMGGMGGSSMGGMGGMSGLGMGGPGMGGPGMGMDEGGSMGGYGMGSTSSASFTDVSPFDLPVEIYGMVYIYNPISPRLREASSQVTADTDLDATPPAVDSSTPVPDDGAAPADPTAPANGAAATGTTQAVQAGG